MTAVRFPELRPLIDGAFQDARTGGHSRSRTLRPARLWLNSRKQEPMRLIGPSKRPEPPSKATGPASIPADVRSSCTSSET